MDKDLSAISSRVWNLQETITKYFYAHILTPTNIYRPLSGHFHALERAQTYRSEQSIAQPLEGAA